jgi:hypothetical protein
MKETAAPFRGNVLFSENSRQSIRMFSVGQSGNFLSGESLGAMQSSSRESREMGERQAVNS